MKVSFIIILLSVPILLTACSTNRDGQGVGETPKYFQVTDDVVYKVEITYGGEDSELVLTEDTLYIMYGEKNAYFNPAFECPIKDLAREPVQKMDLIGIICQGGGNSVEVQYIHIPDSIERETLLQKISNTLTPMLSTAMYDSWRDTQLKLAEQSLKTIGILSPNTCIPNETLEKLDSSGFEEDTDLEQDDQSGADINPAMLMHPSILPIIADPASLFAMGLILAMEDAFPSLGQYSVPHKSIADRTRGITLTSPVGSSAEFRMALTSTAGSILKNQVGFITKPCDASIENEDRAKEELRNRIDTIIKANSFSATLVTHGASALEGDAELLSSCSFSVLDTKNRSTIYQGNVRYVNSRPLNISDFNEINDNLIEDMLQDAYREIAGFVVDGLLSIE